MTIPDPPSNVDTSASCVHKVPQPKMGPRGTVTPPRIPPRTQRETAISPRPYPAAAAQQQLIQEPASPKAKASFTVSAKQSSPRVNADDEQSPSAAEPAGSPRSPLQASRKGFAGRGKPRPKGARGRGKLNALIGSPPRSKASSIATSATCQPSAPLVPPRSPRSVATPAIHPTPHKKGSPTAPPADSGSLIKTSTSPPPSLITPTGSKISMESLISPPSVRRMPGRPSLPPKRVEEGQPKPVASARSRIPVRQRALSADGGESGTKPKAAFLPQNSDTSASMFQVLRCFLTDSV